MTISKSVAAPLAAACATVILLTGSALPQAPRLFHPRIGQAGKDVIWVPTPQPLVEKMLDLTNVTADDIVYDLGSGDGRTVIAAAKRGARAFGVEFNPKMVALSRQSAAKAGVGDRAIFIHGDIFKIDFSKATVITLYLLPTLNMRLRPTILAMKPGTRVASNTFDMGDWPPDQAAMDIPGCSYCRAYYWMVPAKVAGRWTLQNGEITLQQRHQMLAGSVKSGSHTAKITAGKMLGNVIAFTAGAARYTGKLTGNVLAGTVKQGNSAAQWRATRN
jgi:Methyltransferase domain